MWYFSKQSVSKSFLIYFCVLVFCWANLSAQTLIVGKQHPTLIALDSNYRGTNFSAPISLEQQIIPFSLDFSIAYFSSESNLSKSHFLKSLYFNQVGFGAAVDFREARFGGFSNFREVQFVKLADFTKAVFERGVLFWYADFKGKAVFEQSNFQKEAVFGNVNFEKPTQFSEVRFDSLAFFSGSTFKAEADFRSAFFGAEADFSGTVFLEDIDFSKAVFAGRANFLDTKFTKTLNLSQAHFKHTALFYGITLPDTLILTNTQLHKTNLELTEVQLNPAQSTCYINLEGVVLSQVQLDYRYFTLYFNTNTPDIYKKECYQTLMQQFLTIQDEESYQKIKKEYEAIIWEE